MSLLAIKSRTRAWLWLACSAALPWACAVPVLAADVPAAQDTASGSAAVANHVFESLRNEGIAVGEHKFTLPAPTLVDGLDSAGQQQALRTVADERHPVDVLTRRSVVSPFVLKIRTLDDEQGQNTTARAVDLWFVAYGDLNKVTRDGVLDFLREMRGSERSANKPDDDSSGFLPPEQLAERKLIEQGVPADQQRWFFNTFELFDRVRLTATRQAVVTSTPSSILVAIRFDARFNDDAERPNFWQALKRDDLGQLVAGDKATYSATGSYLKMTPLIEPAQGLFIEYHLLFDEPPGWFGGANLIRSKLPVLIEDLVRKARRRLLKTLEE